MPMTLSRTMNVLLHPQELFRRSKSHRDDHGVANGSCRAQVSCFPKSRFGRPAVGMDAVQRLAGDVEELAGQDTLWKTTSGNLDAAGKFAHLHYLSEDVHKHMHTIMDIIKDLTGDVHAPHLQISPDDAVELLEQMIATDLPVQLLAQIPNLEFEARTDIMNVCCAMFWPGMPHHFDQQVVEYLENHPRVFQLLVDGYTNEEAALHYGVVLRSCARHKELVHAFLCSGHVYQLINHVTYPSVDISSDAFYSLREMLLEHKETSAAWLESNFAEFFSAYNELLKSGEYFAERQAQKLLTEILLDRAFKKVMQRYVADERNLQIHMNLLKDRSKVIQIEAFHVFKVFVANPNKTPRTQLILYRNSDKLIQLLEVLHPFKKEDAKFNEDKRNVIERLGRLEGHFSPGQFSPVKDACANSASKDVSPGSPPQAV